MKRMIGVILCMLLLGSLTGITQCLATNTVLQKTSTTSMEDDVPIWDVGDSWTYLIDTCNVQFFESGQLIGINLSMDSFLVEVKETTATSYVLGISGKIQGSFEYDDGAGTTLAGRLYFTKISGTMQLRKADLAVEEALVVIRGIALLKEHPLPISIPIPVPLTITLNVEQSAPRPLIDFPLYDGKEGIISEAHLSANIKVESIVLKILNIFNSEIPKEIILDQVMDIPMLLYTANAEEVTVQAGTFTAYDITFFEGLLGSIYYASATGNIIKAEAEMDIPDQLAIRFHGELKQTNYE
jgi:hypothetical protein